MNKKRVINIFGLVLFFITLFSIIIITSNPSFNGFFIYKTQEYSENSFVSYWNTEDPYGFGFFTNSTQIKLPLEEDGIYDFIVDWGDGTTSHITQWNQEEVIHNYEEEGSYEVNITGTIQGFRTGGVYDGEDNWYYINDQFKLYEIRQWGNISLGNNGAYFSGSEYLQILAEDELNINGITNFSDFFLYCYEIDNINGIENWDVSGVTDMSGMFSGTSFNQDISDWDVSGVTDMSYMFSDTLFDQNISGWNVNSVTNMSGMFRYIESFNQDISGWDVSGVTDMSYMFSGTPFNQDISGWDVSGVTDMSYMFSATPFNQDISGWDVSGVTDMSYMFSGTPFNQDISGWDVSGVTDMTGMFSNSNFNQDISGWDTSSVTDMYSMFFGTLFNQDISSWNTSSLNITQFMFANTDYFNQDISSWDVSGVTDMTGMFYDATAFNQDISSWDIRNVVSFGSFLTFSNISTKNYDKLLMNWARLIPLQNSIYLGVANIDYTVGNPENARQYIIDNYGWTFFDGGKISDILSPEVSILNPQNNSYYENSILTLNLSVYDPNLDEVIYNFNGTNITYSSPINISFNVGENTLEVWAIDDYENLNYSYFIFYISQDENEENIEEDISIESSGPLIYYPTENNLKEGYSRIYYVNANSNLIINNENHKLNVDKINKNTVVVTISSNPQTKELSIGEEWKVDLNDDDVFDLLVKINSISGSRTNIMIKKIEEKIIKTNVENDVVNIEEEIIDENYEVEYPDVVENKGNSSYFIISTLILILLVILYFILTKKKVQKNNSFKKKSNKKSQKKSVNRKKNK